MTYVNFIEQVRETMGREKQLVLQARWYAQVYSEFGGVPRQLEINRLVRIEHETRPFSNLRDELYDIARRQQLRIRPEIADEPCPECGQYHDLGPQPHVMEVCLQWGNTIIKF